MRISRGIFLYCALQCSIAYAENFDLKKTLSFAVERAPAFDNLKRNLDIATLEEKSALARFFPSLDLLATHGLQDQDPALRSTPWFSEFNLALTETLYDNGVTVTNFQIAQLRKKQAETRFVSERDRLTLELATEFLQYSLLTKILEIQQGQFKLIKRQYDLISNYYHQGVKTRKDYLRFKTQISRAEINVLNARQDVERSRLDLLRLSGITNQQDPQFVVVNLDSINITPQKKTLPVEQHFEYRLADWQKRINALESDLVSRRYWPEISFTAGANYQANQYMGTGAEFNDVDRLGWNALVTLKYNIFDWGVRDRDRQIARQRQYIADNTVDRTLLNVKADLEKLMYRLEQLEANFRLAKELLALEQSNINLIETEYRNGRVAYLDLVTGLRDLADAQVKYYSALADLQTAEFTYRYHQGNLYETLSK